MSNQLPAVFADTLTALSAVTAEIDNSVGDHSYLKLTKTGEWVYGSDEIEIPEDSNSVFAVNVSSFFRGYQSWLDGELMGEEMRLVTEPAIVIDSLNDTGAPWKQMLGFQLAGIKGEDKGVQLIYKTTSVGGIKAVGALMKTLVARTQSDHGGALIPLIRLDTSSYRHKKYGKIFTPILEVVGWASESDMVDEATTQPEPEPPVEEAPQAEAEEAPRRRRRRRTA